jgi:hypothetical protein
VIHKVCNRKNYLHHNKLLYNAVMEPIKPKMGRPPKSPEERLEQRSIRLTSAQWAKIDALGIPWLRKLIDRAKPPKTQE